MLITQIFLQLLMTHFSLSPVCNLEVVLQFQVCQKKKKYISWVWYLFLGVYVCCRTPIFSPKNVHLHMAMYSEEFQSYASIVLSIGSGSVRSTEVCWFSLDILITSQRSCAALQWRSGSTDGSSNPTRHCTTRWLSNHWKIKKKLKLILHKNINC